MIKLIIALHSFITISKSSIFSIVTLNVLEAFFAVSGIALLFPLIKFLQVGPEVFASRMNAGPLKYLKIFVDQTHVEMSLGLLLSFAFLPLLMQTVMRYLKETNTYKLQQRVTFQIREKLFKVLFMADIDYYARTKLGDIANILTMSAMRSGLIVRYLVGFFSFFVISIIYCAVLLTISFKLTLVSMCIISLIPLLTEKRAGSLHKVSKMTESTNAKLHIYIVDRLKSIKRILLLNTQPDEEKFFSQTAKGLERIIVKGLRVNSFVNAVLEPLFFGSILLIIFVGIKFLHMDFAVLVLFLYVLSRINPMVKGIINNRNQILIYHKSFEQVQRAYDNIKQATTIVNGKKAFEGLKKEISFKEVGFSYEHGTHLFQGISFCFKRGQTTALVGKSGAGKSTIVDLVLRFRDVDSGKICIDGTNIKELDINSFRRKVGVVTQDIMLFHGTILENITYGLEGLTHEEINNACKMAYADEFIDKLENGYNTYIGEAGAMLSGGQKQRLALAHMFLQHPDIIILDEPVSALDSESEKVIKGAIEKLRGKKTIIMVAHRMSSIKDADKIIVLDSGWLKEEGTYEELIQRGGFFKNMIELQQV